MDEPPSSKKIKRSEIKEYISWEEECFTFPKAARNFDLLSYTTDGLQISFQVSKEVMELYEESDCFTSVAITVIIKPEARYGFELLLQTVRIQNTERIPRLDWSAPLLCSFLRRKRQTDYVRSNYCRT